MRLIVVQFPWQQESWNWIINWIWLLLLLVYMFYGQRLQVSIWVRQIKRALQKLEYMVRKGKEITIKAFRDVGNSDANIVSRINDFLEFFMIEPVDRDPSGIMYKLEHLVNVRDERFEHIVAELAPNVSRDQAANLENVLEAIIALNSIYRIVRHYLILGEKTKSYILILQLQMQLPEIMKYANAYFDALKAFVDGKPIGDGAGVLSVTRLLREHGVVGKEQYEEIVKDTVIAQTKIDDRTVIAVRARGPGGTVGKPGEAIRRLFEERKLKIDRIIMIDAGIKLEGEKTGGIMEGVGAAIGGIGVDKYKIEEVATKYKVPLDAIIIKESIEEAVSPMRREIAEATRKVVERIKRIINERTKPGDVVLIAGIGNTIGIGY